jgi:hypothetical protein
MRLLDLAVEVDERREMLVEQLDRAVPDVFRQRIPGLVHDRSPSGRLAVRL